MSDDGIFAQPVFLVAVGRTRERPDDADGFESHHHDTIIVFVLENPRTKDVIYGDIHHPVRA
ncbi:hypothetical protein [Methylobacterium sp. Leaf93]|uniref:hypothetical protein n=1 Tax=Methylobacterium sp. Leaf93 TaxID=1736249 RepID=UPI0012E716DE|nr:hypothetical protein [Methylobacterium sp. Leaf93]